MLSSLGCAALLLDLPTLQAGAPDAFGAVATENARSTNEALQQLRWGGNAVDAAVTAALVAGVVSPTSSGLGGGCFINLFDPKLGIPVILDARESAPKDLAPEDFDARPFAFEQRGKWVGVPGELQGLYELHRRFGRRTWQEVVTPAAVAAEEGFAVSPHLANVTRATGSSFAGDPSLKEAWLSPLREQGAKVSSPRLGATLRRVASEGPKALYEGAIAAELVNTVHNAGGWLSLADLSGYRVKERTAIHTTWEGLEVYTMPPPSAGGLLLAQTLAQFTRSDLTSLGLDTPAYRHALAETFRAALADRMRYVGDPDLEQIDLATLLDARRLRERRERLSLERTHALGRFVSEEHGTHHIVVRDGEGRVVSLTTTVNRVFGAKLTAPSSGVVLNDQLDDFTLTSDANRLGIPLSPNRARPLARPVSSMTPTIVVKDGKVVLAAGGSGGMNIAPETTQAILAALAFDLPPERAVSTPRFQVPLDGRSILVPQDTPIDQSDELTRRGEVVGPIRFNGTAVQMLSFDGRRPMAAADPRKQGTGGVTAVPGAAKAQQPTSPSRPDRPAAAE
jgi:gamma-glutamyltranspeptidase/glutathione hydrolase